ncbi:MAG: cyclomaltodextrinase [Candidatus Cloacimonetes bacterium]|nr:cyclomaltodextrinase [Candidatus Cloacimonadota bacterium]
MKFTYKPLTGGKHKVFISGDFNNWKPDEYELAETNGIYEIELELPQGRYEYKFIVDGNWLVDETAENIVRDKFGNRNSLINVALKKEAITQKATDFNTPDWVKDGVFYQIFTDRFCNGDHTIDPDFSEWYYQKENILSPAARFNKFQFISDWYQIEPLKDEEHKNYLFYGGDLAGVYNKIDYLKELGITIIYFNPLVTAESNHKYEAYDYFKIDPHFGTNELFIKLVKELHNNGIRVIVDFAFNHVGLGFFAFQDCLKNGPKSKYYNWFDWHKWPIPDALPEQFDAREYYQCWWGHSIMPDLNFDLDRTHPEENYIKDQKKANVNIGVVDYILDVVEFWLMEFDIDGFRLDIPNEVPFWFWKIFREKVKTLKPDAYLIGEIWHNAAEWVNDKYFDAVMNYNYFKDPVYNYFLKNTKAKDFVDKINEGLVRYPKQATQVMMNLLDSHDTFRFLESANGKISTLKLAVLFQMTFVGSPHIFYGDEVGMRGGHDPENRQPFNWKYSEEEESVNLRNWYKRLIRIRKENAVLRRGNFEFISATNNALIYKRSLENDELIIIINKSTHPLKLKQNMLGSADLITGETIETVSAQNGVILKNERI